MSHPHHRPTPRRLALACALALGAPLAQAQVIEDLELRRDGANAVLTIRLAMPVQLRRAVNAGTDDLVQVYYDALPSRERPAFLDGERRQVGGGALPVLSVAEDGSGTELSNRKLVLRSSRPLKMRVRPGRNAQTLDVQLDGLGEALLAATPAAAPAGGGSGTDAEVEARATALLGQARDALTRGEPDLAIENLNEALNLPPNPRSADAQALVAEARLAKGDRAGARREAELYLQLHPQGAQARAVRALLAGLEGGSAPAPVPEAEPAERSARRGPQRTLTGAFSQYFYGGNSKTLTQLKDTPLEGQVPQVVSEQTLSGTDQKQLSSSADVNWRERDAERDLRLSFRDQYTWDQMPDRPSRNRLTALWADWKETAPGLQARVGRQSGLGGGVLGRFDGVTGGWTFAPKWKLQGVAGQPTDALLDTHRWFAGASVEAEALLPQLGASAYGIQQQIDGQVDRRALGLDLRWFSPETTVFSQLEYDQVLKGLNIASVQGTYTLADSTTVNLLLDRRAVPMLMLGNVLFFADPTLPTMPRTLTELLKQRSLSVLRQQVSDTTAYSTQGLLGATTPINTTWQVGADLRLTRVDAIQPVPGILPQGLPATGNLWSGGLQLIGSNLYSERDTHVLNLTAIKSPTFKGWLLSYNNLSLPIERLQVEPSLRLYGQDGPNGMRSTRWTPGLRLAWRGGEKWTLESEISIESGRTTGPQQNESATRLYYYLGYRLDL
jgi:hypothetical protein